jgi:hypothetical protein
MTKGEKEWDRNGRNHREDQSMSTPNGIRLFHATLYKDIYLVCGGIPTACML